MSRNGVEEDGDFDGLLSIIRRVNWTFCDF